MTPTQNALQSPKSIKGKVDFGILTIREDEFDAVLRRFPPFGSVEGHRIYNLHQLDLPDGGSYLIAIVKCIEQGNTEALDAARDLLEELEPQWLLVVGIAGALPSDEHTLGDVVVSTRIHDFSVEAVLQDKPAEYAMMGGPIHKNAAKIVANLRALKSQLHGWNTPGSIGVSRPAIEIDNELFYGDDAWQKKVRNALACHSARSEPMVISGAIGSSDRLIKDVNILASFLLKTARQVIAVEMESAGVYRGATGRQVPSIAIRGLSDIVGFKRHPDWTAYACHSAAAFTRAFLLSRPILSRAGLSTTAEMSTKGRWRKLLALFRIRWKLGLIIIGVLITALIVSTRFQDLVGRSNDMTVVPASGATISATTMPTPPHAISAATRTASPWPSATSLKTTIVAQPDSITSQPQRPATPTQSPPIPMAHMPGARLIMGSYEPEINEAIASCHPTKFSGCQENLFKRESPAHAVEIQPFSIDVHEVTNQQFAAWLNAAPNVAVDEDGVVTQAGVRILFIRHELSGVYAYGSRWKVKPGFEEVPVVLVTWNGASLCCHSRGARLPSEAEWELAARGVERRPYAWPSRAHDCDGVIFGRSLNEPCAARPPGPRPVHEANLDRTPEGLLGMGGNVREWVLDAFVDHYETCPSACPDPGLEQRNTSSAPHVIRGCGWADPLHLCRAASRSYDEESGVDPSVGFRCASSANKSPNNAGTP